MVVLDMNVRLKRALCRIGLEYINRDLYDHDQILKLAEPNHSVTYYYIFYFLYSIVLDILTLVFSLSRSSRCTARSSHAPHQPCPQTPEWPPLFSLLKHLLL